MVIKITEEQAKLMKIKPASNMKIGLIDPLLVDKVGILKQKKDTSHKAPKVAKRISGKLNGPEGSGRFEKNKNGDITKIVIDLELLPVPKERARTVRTKDKKTISFTPLRTKRFTSDVALVLNSFLPDNSPINGPVKIIMEFRMEIPASWPIWKKESAASGYIAPTGRPDMDNLEKALLDSMNNRVFIDDAYVVERIAKKIYSNTPGIYIEITKLENMISVKDKRQDLDNINNI